MSSGTVKIEGRGMFRRDWANLSPDVSPISQQFNCIVTVKDGKIVTDFDWLNGADAWWFLDEGQSMRLQGVVVSDDGFRLDDVEILNGLDNKKG